MHLEHFSPPQRPYDGLQAELAQFNRVGIESLQACALLRRVDSKFLVPVSALKSLLPALQENYGILPAGGNELANYQTLYFDSEDKVFFHQHRRGQRDRFKVRIRHYLDRQKSYLEVKRKTNRDLTIKSRCQRPFLSDRLNAEDIWFLREHTQLRPPQLHGQLWTDFSRITLVGLGFEERLTIDLKLSFKWGVQNYPLNKLAVIEVKQPRFSARSPAMLALRQQGLRSSGMSKYCIAQITLHPRLRSNRLQPRLRNIARIAYV